MRDLETLFDRPPATEADLADARARFTAAAGRSRPRGRSILKPFLAALMTTLLATTAAVVLRPVPAAVPEPSEPTGGEILLRAAQAALDSPPPVTRVKPGAYFHLHSTHRGWDHRKRKGTINRVDVWTPADGSGPWLRTVGGGEETLFSDLCFHRDPGEWPQDLRPLVVRRPGDPPSFQFRQIAELLDLTAFHPERTAALLRFAAGFPGLIVTRGRENTTGRPAITVGVQRDGFRDELVFDPVRFRLLGQQQVVTELSAKQNWTPVGTVSGREYVELSVEPRLPDTKGILKVDVSC
ncbi:hypothetical protein [Herbidospora mongoliensis]|uniref:hypothetical protein n=1 Tax=Herbidospora mongoliensis TaxID=688067 RepID=UPI00083517FB|nr:hypothetical protein [Herbidospora mongoliensis]